MISHKNKYSLENIAGQFFYLFILGVFLVCRAAIAADVSSPGIEVYVAGQKFSSLEDYRRLKEKERQEAKAAVAVSAEAAAVKKVPAAGARSMSTGIIVDPFMGKTVTIRPDGTTITSQTSLDQGKTIRINQRQGRVAGVQPSFAQVEKDFDAGQSGNGVKPQGVSSAAELEEDLHQRVGASNSPVLLISDKQKVRVMELEPSQ
ncbi:MAG: hypothetical protein HQL22_01080 [Candidatus Omnitrophica bacterium]|nr:hypothetical protein [Candidatus Omnitrophota bacterium]